MLDLSPNEALVWLGVTAARAFEGHAEMTSVTEALRAICGADAVAIVRAIETGVETIAVSGNQQRLRASSDAWLSTFGPLSDRQDGGNGGMTAYNLEVSGGAADLILCAGPDAQGTNILASVMPTLRVLWNNRAQGVVEATLASETTGFSRAHPLSDSNPCGLTRAERSVAEHVARGLRASEIARRLDCALPTVRTHLRNLYSKTGCAGIVELVHLLQPRHVGATA